MLARPFAAAFTLELELKGAKRYRLAMMKEFREFAARGNVIDLAVGVIIGAAFGKIVTSLVNDIVMPPIGMAIGRVDFKNLFVALNGQQYASLADAQKAGAPTINYGIVPEHGARVPDCRVRHLPDGAPDQPTEDAGAGAANRRRARLPVLHLAHPGQGDALPALHV